MQGLQEWTHSFVILLIIATVAVPQEDDFVYVLPIPPLLHLLWLVCDGCPLSAKKATGERDHFVHRQLSMLCPGITEKQTNLLIGLGLTTIPVILCYRALLARTCEKQVQRTR